MRRQIKHHVPVLTSNCASACKLSPSFSPSLYIYAFSALWEDIQRNLACHCTCSEMQMCHTGDRGAETWAYLALLDRESTAHRNNPTAYSSTQDLKEEQRRSEVKAKFGFLILKSISIFMRRYFISTSLTITS